LEREEVHDVAGRAKRAKIMSSSQEPAAELGILRSRPETIAKPSSSASGSRPLGLGATRDGALYIPNRPDATKPAPLIVALHGAGGVASQLIDLLVGPADTHGIIILAPESRSSTWDVIRGGYGPDVLFIDQALQKVFDLYAINPQQIAVAGFSDGASYALSIGIINGSLFGDILAFSPGFMAPTQQSDTPRIFISHGVRDEVLPIDRCSRRLVPTLKKAGYDVDYQEFQGGHVAPADMVERAIRRFLG
jgi:phospholipase/carboxylesterase